MSDAVTRTVATQVVAPSGGMAGLLEVGPRRAMLSAGGGNIQ